MCCILETQGFCYANLFIYTESLYIFDSLTKTFVMTRLIIVALLCCFAATSWSQKNNGTLFRIFTTPASETVIINDKKLEHGNMVFLDSGANHIRLWATNHYSIDTVVFIEQSEMPVDFTYNFQPLKSYKVHLKKSSHYFNRKTLNVYMPIAISGGLIISMGVTYFSAQSNYERANELWDEYLYQDFNLDGSFANFEKVRDKYKKQRESFYIQGGVLLLSSYFLYKGIQWLGKNKKPHYKSEKDPFLSFDKAFLTSNSLNSNSSPVQLGLTFNLN